mmetsp:Transcript_15274/g.35389  ORF Transcript_15274/g.35389 Transcript_15274/m.35389 type:complete len:269 (+) Transcript_15274:1680-2486(+)
MLGESRRFLVIDLAVLVLVGVLRAVVFSILRDTDGIPHAGSAEFPEFLAHGVLVLVGPDVPQGRRSRPAHFGKVGAGVSDSRNGLPHGGEGDLVIRQKGWLDLVHQQGHAGHVLLVVHRLGIQVDCVPDSGAAAQKTTFFPSFLIGFKGRLLGVESLRALDRSHVPLLQSAFCHLFLPSPRFGIFEEEPAHVLPTVRSRRRLLDQVASVFLVVVELPIEIAVVVLARWIGFRRSTTVVITVAGTLQWRFGIPIRTIRTDVRCTSPRST